MGGIKTLDEAFPFGKIPIGTLAKTTEAIDAGNTGLVEKSDVDGVLSGGKFRAKNISETDILTDKFIYLGEDDKRNAFFNPCPSGGEECNCSNLFNRFECWDMGWLQDLTGGGQIGGGFSLRIEYILVDGAGVPIVDCKSIAELLNCNVPCVWQWAVDDAILGTRLLQEFPFNPAVDTINLFTPWGDIVSYGVGFNNTQYTIIDGDCGDTSVDIFGTVDITSEQSCPGPTGESGPCKLGAGDPRQACIDACTQ